MQALAIPDQERMVRKAGKEIDLRADLTGAIHPMCIFYLRCLYFEGRWGFVEEKRIGLLLLELQRSQERRKVRVDHALLIGEILRFFQKISSKF